MAATPTTTPYTSAADAQAGLTKDLGPTTDAQRQAISAASALVPAITSTPTMVSSKDAAGGFASNTSALNQMTGPGAPTIDNNTYTATDPTSGAVLSYKVVNGQVQYQNSPTSSAGIGGTGALTAVQKGAGAGAGDGSTPTVTSGDPVYDSLQQWEATQAAKAEADATARKQQVNDMLKTNIANNDAEAAATIAGIQNTYSALIDTQTRIGNMDIARTKAYGLAGSGAIGASIEFTNAVSLRETDAMNALKKLDGERDAAIAKAKAARDTGDASLLQASMDDIAKISDDVRSQLSTLSQQVADRATALQKVEEDQKAKQKEDAQALLASAYTQFGDAYNQTADNVSKDAIIKNIVNASGGLVDYGTALSYMETQRRTAAADASKAAQDKADLAYKQAQTNLANTNIAQAPAELAQTQAQTRLIQAQIAKTNAEAAQVGKDAGVDPANILAYAHQYAATGNIPTGLPKGTFGDVARLAKEAQKPDGTIVSNSTGVVPTNLSATQADGMAALYDLTKKLDNLQTLYKSTGITSSFADRQRYKDVTGEVVDLLARARSGAALTEDEVKNYSAKLPQLFSAVNLFNFNLTSTGIQKITDLKGSISGKLDTSLAANNASIFGYSKVDVDGQKYTVGQIVTNDKGQSGRINSDGSITIIQ